MATKKIRIHFPADLKRKILKAAKMSGESFGFFVRRAADREAATVLSLQENALVVCEGAAFFCQILDEAPKPTATLRNAMNRHARKYG